MGGGPAEPQDGDPQSCGPLERVWGGEEGLGSHGADACAWGGRPEASRWPAGRKRAWVLIALALAPTSARLMPGAGTLSLQAITSSGASLVEKTLQLSAS